MPSCPSTCSCAPTTIRPRSRGTRARAVLRAQQVLEHLVLCLPARLTGRPALGLTEALINSAAATAAPKELPPGMPCAGTRAVNLPYISSSDFS